MLVSAPALAYEKLLRGSKGDEVAAMQEALKSLGYSITVDGNYGAGTMNTVKSFQKKYDLKQDGIAGNQTLALLYSLAPSYDPEKQTPSQSTATVAPAANPAQGTGLTAVVTTTGGSLNLRASKSANVKVLTTIPNGTVLSITSRGSTWCGTSYNGKTGYVMTEFLHFTNAPVTTATPAPATNPPVITVSPAPSATGGSAIVSTTGGSLNLRESAKDSARILTTIPNGSRVTVTARGSTWSGVNWNGNSGYVMSKFLAFEAAVPTATPAPAQAPAGTRAYVTTTGGSLNLRQSANANAKVLTTIPNGTALTITTRGNTWCAAAYQGVAGYVMTSFLRFADAAPTASPTPQPTAAPAAGSSSAYVTTTGNSLNLRESANANAKVLTTIPNGTQLTVTSRGSAWCAVVYNGTAGYVMTQFLTFTASASPTAAPAPSPAAGGGVYALVTTSGGSLNLRQSASSSVKVLTTIPNAATVLVTERGSEWCAVTYGGTAGYVMTKFLTFLSAAPTATPVSDAGDADPSVYTRTLRSGMTGEDVRWVQGRLQELGYTVTVNGKYDSTTIAAVKAFQSKNGLTSDGLAGSQTFAVLHSENARKATDANLSYTTLRIGNTGAEVTALQQALKGLGYNVTVNGTYDTNTHNAVVAFQVRNGLVISGIADSLTRAVLQGGQGKPYSTPVSELPADAGKIQGPSLGQIKLLHWVNEIKPSVKAGQTYTIFDPNTSLSWNLVFYSLGRHADSQPASWRDTQIMNRSFGSTSWTIHPVYVKLPSGQWTMATMHNRPHLYGSITDNGFGGHLCVHFLRDMEEAQKNDPDYGVNNQVVLRNAWKTLTGETVN